MFMGGKRLFVLGSDTLAGVPKARELMARSAKRYLQDAGQLIVISGEQGPAYWAAEYCRQLGVSVVERGCFVKSIAEAEQVLFWGDTRDEELWRRVNMGVSISMPSIGYRWCWNSMRWLLVMT